MTHTAGKPQNRIFLIFLRRSRKKIRNIPQAPSTHIMDKADYWIRNAMGSVYVTGTGFPSCRPGFHFGMARTTRRAS